MIFLDMDDVLCDFHTAYADLIHPEIPEFTINQWNHWKHQISTQTFACLTPLPWFDGLKRLAMEYGDYYVITSCELAHHIEGKLQWLTYHWPEVLQERRLIISQPKWLCAKKGRLLVDDYIHNTQKWCMAGGSSIRVPAPYQNGYTGRDINLVREVRKWIQYIS